MLLPFTCSFTSAMSNGNGDTTFSPSMSYPIIHTFHGATFAVKHLLTVSVHRPWYGIFTLSASSYAFCFLRGHCGYIEKPFKQDKVVVVIPDLTNNTGGKCAITVNNTDILLRKNPSNYIDVQIVMENLSCRIINTHLILMR